MAKLTEGSDWLTLSCDFIPKSVILLMRMGCSKRLLGLDCVTSPLALGVSWETTESPRMRIGDSWPPKEILKREHSFLANLPSPDVSMLVKDTFQKPRVRRLVYTCIT